MKKFWDFIRNEGGERILRLEGPVDEDNFWGDEVTPSSFREELEAEEGDVTVWINSPGGNVFAAAEIYTMLCEHKGKITVKIDAIAASAASVIAMAGDRVLMSPVAMLMIHDPMTIAMGNTKDMEKAISTLNEVKASIINAYQRKTGLSRNKISQLMEDETWMNAKRAVELGFADEVLYSKKDVPEPEESKEEKDDGKEIEASWEPFSTKAMGKRVLNRLVCSAEIPSVADEESDESEGDEADVEPVETGVTAEAAKEAVKEATEPDAATDAPKEKNPEAETSAEPKDTAPRVPVIGMDGKTEDGSMPYELLKNQLELIGA